MPVQRPPRPLPVLVSVLAAAGLVLTAASCAGHITPLGPDQAATMPQPHHLRSPLILQDMRTQGLVGRVGQPGGCPAGWVALSGGDPGQPSQCYRKTGTSVTITAAAVSPVFSFRPPTPPGQQQAPPVQYGFSITVPAADVPALAAVFPAAPGSPGPPTASAVNPATPMPAISVASRTWILLGYSTPEGREFEVTLPSRNQALQLHRILVPSG
jgi:hypothetical protein